MKIAIMGAGGVGGFYGARMARAGEEVVFIARGEHLQAMQAKGLRVISESQGDFALPRVQATDDPATVGEVDLIWMTCKAYDLEQAAEMVGPMIGENSVVIPFLNGVDNAERIGAVVGMGHLLGGTVFVNANIVEPGVIRHLTMDRLIFGELEGGISDRGTAIHRMFEATGIQAELSPNIAKEIWSKFVVMNAISGVASVVRKPEREIVDDPEIRTLLVASLGEGEELARGQGDQPG